MEENGEINKENQNANGNSEMEGKGKLVNILNTADTSITTMSVPIKMFLNPAFIFFLTALLFANFAALLTASTTTK